MEATESDLAEARIVERNLGTCENWIMATATSPTAPQYVQQAFNWEDLETTPPVVKPSAREVYAQGHSRSQLSSQPLTVPTFTTSTSVRRGRCEHVGGILASVLERYGIGIDQLIAEIDGLK